MFVIVVREHLRSNTERDVLRCAIRDAIQRGGLRTRTATSEQYDYD